jgi:hypothetical protein
MDRIFELLKILVIFYEIIDVVGKKHMRNLSLA